MSATHTTDPGRQDARPWYCSDKAIEEYRLTLAVSEQDLPMIKTLKVTQSIIVNLGVIIGWLYAMSLGGDPLYVSALAMSLIGAFNGIALSDYVALLQAYQEIQSEKSDSNDSE